MPPNLPDALGGGGRRTIAARPVEDLLLLGGWAIAPDAAGAEVARAEARAVLARLAAGEARHDPAEIVNRMILAGRAGTLDFWRSHYVATGRRLLAEAAGGGAIAELPPRRFTVEVSRRFDLTGHAGRARLRLPLPIAGPVLRDLAVTPLLPASVAEHRVAPGRLEALVPEPPAEIVIAARVAFTASPGPADEDAAPDPVWLAAGEGAIQVTPRVRALADALAGPAKAPAAAARAFYDHLLDGFTCGVVPPERVTGAATDWVLATGWYDCRLGAALFCALCRARGLPARLVGGYLLWRAPTEHFWAEVHLPGQGWTPYDLLGWDLSAGGADPEWRHVLAGAVDYRLVTQRLPRLFTGAAGGPAATARHRLVRATAAGTETRYVAVADGRLLHAEDVRITG